MKKGLDLIMVSPSLLGIETSYIERNKITCCQVCRNETIFCCFCKWRKSLFAEFEKERGVFLE